MSPVKKPETLFEYNYEPVNANQVLAAAHKRIAELKSRIAEADEKICLNDARIANLKALTSNIDAQIEVRETLLASKDRLTQSDFIKLEELEEEYLRLKIEYVSLNKKAQQMALD